MYPAEGAAVSTRKTASTAVSVHPLLAERWSPRGFDRAHEIGDEALAALLEAARWAPSAGNSQPWRFLVTRRGEPAHDRLFAALAPGNQAWAGAASALILVAARTADDDGRPQPWALYDTGQAWPPWSRRRRPTDWPCTRWAGSTPTPSAPGSAWRTDSRPSSSSPWAARTARPACPSRWPPAKRRRGPGTRSATCCCPPPPRARWPPERSLIPNGRVSRHPGRGGEVT